MGGTRTCLTCGYSVNKPPKLSWGRWEKRFKYCSNQCKYESYKQPLVMEGPDVILTGEMAIITILGGEVIVDLAYATWLASMSWHVSSTGYAVNRRNGKTVRLHHLIVGKPPKGSVTDHINRNKLDNRRENLRITSQKINASNSALVDKARYYCWDTGRKRWMVKFKGKYIGRFVSELEAKNKVEELTT